MPSPAWEISWDLGIVQSLGRELSRMWCHSVHHPKLPFPPGKLISIAWNRAARSGSGNLKGFGGLGKGRHGMQFNDITSYDDITALNDTLAIGSISTVEYRDWGYSCKVTCCGDITSGQSPRSSVTTLQDIITPFPLLLHWASAGEWKDGTGQDFPYQGKWSGFLDISCNSGKTPTLTWRLATIHVTWKDLEFIVLLDPIVYCLRKKSTLFAIAI